MNILIGNDTGIGNQVEFIPVINRLLSKGHNIYSEASLYSSLGLNVKQADLKRYDAIYLPFGYDLIKLLKVIIKHPFTPKYGYKYRILKKHFGLGYKKSYKFNEYENETRQNIKNFGGKLITNKPQETGVVLVHYDKRTDRGISLGTIIELFYYLNFNTNLEPSILTTKETLKEAINEIKNAEYFIGTDTGLAHIADYFGLKSIIYYGSTDSIKSGTINGHNIQSKLKCSPCYNWGKIKCTNEIKYQCLKLTTKQIINDINTLWFKEKV